MYLPKAFEETRVEALHACIATHPFGALVTVMDGVADANHLPFVLSAEHEPFGTLYGHVSRANALATADGLDVLVLFSGPDCYISPSHYPSKQEHGKVVPTWNYVVVHARGRLRLIGDRDWLLRHLEQLTTRHEAARSEPWSIADAPDTYIEAQLAGIVGLEIRITSLIGKSKVSQNRSAADRDGVITGLRHEPNDNARAMGAAVAARGIL